MAQTESHFDILVLGGGPAGAAAALGLMRLGYRVALVTQPRSFASMEGISQRVVEGLRGAGLADAVEALAAPSPRQVTWNGETSAANTEILVERASLDRALRVQLKAAGVRVFEVRVEGVGQIDQGWSAALSGSAGPERLTAGFLVEARGRSAPAAGQARIKGPDTLSLLHYWQGPTVQPFSAVESIEDGWAWMAAGADGRRYLQLTLDAKATPLPKKAELAGYCEARFRGLGQAGRFIVDAAPTEQVQARTSASILHSQVVGERWIRIGDAAMAVDPLSGNGIFQALSSALVAPAVINTLLNYPRDATTATAFYQQRTSQLFYRFARIGRDFYRMESRWRDRPFWYARSGWPDAIEAHGQADTGRWSIERRPVIDDNRVRPAEVLVTPDQPLGIWHLQGVELAPVMRLIDVTPGPEVSPQLLASALSLTPVQAQRIFGWLQQQGFIRRS